MRQAGPGICDSKYVEDVNERAECQGLGQQHNTAKKSDRSANRASADAGPELACREGHAAMESPQALIEADPKGLVSFFI